MAEFLKKIEFGAGELLLIILILLDVLEFAGMVPLDIFFIKRIIEWMSLGYLLYRADITEIIFGYKDKIMNILLIFSYFMLIMKDFLVFSKTIAIETGSMDGSLVMPLYIFLRDNAFQFEIITFYIGAVMLIFVACFNLFMNMDIKKPSIMAMLHEEGQSAGIADRLKRTFSSFLIFVLFFIFVFNLVMEWLGWVIDSPIILFAIFFYLIFFIKYSKRFSATTFIYKVGDAGSDLYTNAIKMFHSKETIMVGVIGILILHLVTDVGVFLIPYTLGKEIDYLTELGTGHSTIPALVSSSIASIAGITLPSKIFIIGGYVLNIIAAIFLMFGPALIWYEFYSSRKIRIPKYAYFLFYSSIIYLILNPVFSIEALNNARVAGVNILTSQLSAANYPLYFILAVCAGIAAFLLTYIHFTKRMLKYIMFSSLGLFFAYYIMLFSYDVAMFYVAALASGSVPLLASAYFVIFLISTLLFYVSGGLYFIYISLYKLHKKEI